MESPLPVRDGVNATRLRVPEIGPWPTMMAYVLERFGHVNSEAIIGRFERGEVRGIGGTVITPETALGEHRFLWYYRELPQEERLPVEVSVLHRDADLLVVDKPHFLPTTPGGRFVAESALVRLRRALDLPELTPIHRLDRMTAGVVLFSINPQSRGAYHLLFENRLVRKSYEAVAPVRDDLGLPLRIATRIHKPRAYLLSQHVPGPANAITEIELDHSWSSPAGSDGLYRLEPHSGKTHQLRLHMATLGIGIRHDPFYPVLRDEAPDDFSRPLQLLARSIEFTDPLSGERVIHRSRLSLSEAH